MGTEKKVAKNDNEDVIAKIVGDFYPNFPPADLSNFDLFKPSIPVTHARVLEGTRTWMFVPKE